MRIPSYLVKNHNGIYYFRYVIPKKDLYLFPKNSREFRRSLKTRSKPEAIKRARVYWVRMMDKKNQNLEQEISTWENELRQGSSLLEQLDHYEKSYQTTFDPSDYEEFIAHLSNYDVHCIELATKYRQSQANKDPLDKNTITASSVAINLSDIFVEYIKDKGSIEPKTSEGYTRHFNLFIRITNITTTQELSVLSVRRYKNILAELPPRVGQDKKFINKSIDSILEMEYPSKLAFKTMKENLVTVRSFLKWLSVQMYIETDLSGLS